ncbi:hypothetical protein TorRG33x02_050820 [Trema orientale]|uniref:Uncharacterized protein n=1 Tax=Trema orientale TaxID=63057 RepID=A0A2P5FN48_TREOI|nr:hypothetical protein TorRG33x02_050820 [Trema orientale]
MVVLDVEWGQNDEIGHEEPQICAQNSVNELREIDTRRAVLLRPVVRELLWPEFGLGSTLMADDWRRNRV